MTPVTVVMLVAFVTSMPAWLWVLALYLVLALIGMTVILVGHTNKP